MDRRCMGCMELYNEQFEVCPFCGYLHGTPGKEAYHITPGSILAGRYIMGRVLGFGGFGITYMAYDQVLATKVAIKEYMPGEFSTRMPNQQVVTIYSGEREEQFREGMLKIIDEARRLAQFQDEPNIVHIFDCFEANSTAYIVMEYLDGESVKALLARDGKMPVKEALDLVLKVISGLKKVHAVGIIHRDIAPDNIYILKNGDIKILDFGAARYATTKHSKSLSVIIKPGYAPEEQYRSRGDQGTWTDVYALSATFYKLITGATPEDAMERSVKDLLKKPSKLGVSIPKAMETAVLNALNVRIEDRTQTVEEFEQELMAAEVKERAITRRRADVGKIPLWSKIAAAAGGIGVIALIIILLTVNFMPGLEEYTLPEGKTIVPNLVNLKQEEAVSIGEEKRIAVVPDRMMYSAVIPAGNVTGQSVSKGTQVDEDSQVLIEISRGKEKVVVPLVEGMFKEDAVMELEKAELAVELKETSSDDVAPGSVVSQSIEGNTTAVKGNSIILEIARDDGRGDASIEVVLPDLSGMSYEEAKNRLKEDYLYLRPVYEYSDAVEEGRIISQAVKEGDKLPQKSNIEVVVSMGREKVQVPGVELTALEEARETLAGYGLEAEIIEEYSDSIGTGRVISQIPAADEMAEKGSTVQLTVSKGKEPQSNPERQDSGRQRNQGENRPPAATPAPTQAPAPTPTPAQTPAPPPTEAPTSPPATAAPDNDVMDQINRQLDLIGNQ